MGFSAIKKPWGSLPLNDLIILMNVFTIEIIITIERTFGEKVNTFRGRNIPNLIFLVHFHLLFDNFQR